MNNHHSADTATPSLLQRAIHHAFQSNAARQTSLLALSMTTATAFAVAPLQQHALIDLTDPDTQHSASIRSELMIIDSRLENIDDLIRRRRTGLIPVLVHPEDDGLDAISQAMQAHPDAAAIHVVSHGEPGQILLGRTAITEQQLNTRTGALRQWVNRNTATRPDLIIYGCNVAQGAVGEQFVSRLQQITGLDIAASTTLTGNQVDGGDWTFESQRGWIEAGIAWREEDLGQISGTLATITVTNLDDAGAGSLRDALDNQVADGDDIDFAVTGTITLTSGELTIANNITINGPGSTNLTIDANNTSRVFYIGNALEVTLAGLTLTNGYTTGNGGLIQSDASSLTINDSVLSDSSAGNFGGAVNMNYAYSSLTIDNTVISNNTADYGGGLSLDNDGQTLTLTNSTIQNNLAYEDGGGINMGDETGVMTITDSTITGNSADDDGGGISVYIDDYNGVFTITNSQITNNTASGNGGGIAVYASSVEDAYADLGQLTLGNVTITGNSSDSYGGGLWLYGEEDFIDTVITGSTISNNTATGPGGGLFFSNDYGYANVDISTTTFDSNVSSGDGGGILIKHETYGSDVTISDSIITNNQAQNGQGGGIHVYHEEDLNSAPYGTLTLTNITITGNSASTYGGGMSFFQSNNYSMVLTINGGTISDNTADDTGGGVHIYGDYLRTVSINNLTISGNSSGNEGGGLAIRTTEDLYNTVQITGTTISGNIADQDGGGVLIDSDASDPIEFFDSTIDSNSSLGNGGGIAIQGSAYVEMTNLTISGNSAQVDGGGIDSGRNLEINNSIVSGNTATSYADIQNRNNLTLANSLIGDSDGLNGYVDNGGNILDTDPLLGPLQDNGGPTLTRSLQSGSPALDAGDNTLNVNAFDQRGPGFPRVVNGLIDMGSVEGVAIDVTLSLTGSPLAENGGIATVTATASSAPTSDILVDLVLTGTATNAVDFSASATQITIPAGLLTGTMTITGIDDPTDEPDETVIVDIDSVSGGIEAGGMQQVTAVITDDDGAPSASLALAGSPLAENGGVATVTGSLSNTSTFDVTIDLGFSGTATNAVDYTPSATQIVVPAGSLSGDLTLTGIDDMLSEGDETIVVDITSVNRALLGPVTQVTAIITDDDAPPPQATASLSSVQVVETAGVVTYTVNLDGPAPAGGVTIDLAFSGTATNGVDYTASAMQIVIPAGSTSGSIQFTIIDDGLVEPTETIVIDIVGIVGATVSGSPTAVLSILGAPVTIPTLSAWGMILLGLLIPGFAARRMRQKKVSVEIR